jgi:hypothetical protein
MMVGGGVRGRDVGTAHGITTQVGSTIKVFHTFMHKYAQIGEKVTGSIVGKDIGGTTNEYRNNTLNKVGRAGRKINIGSKNPGMLKDGENKGGRDNKPSRKVKNTERTTSY